MPHTPGHLSQLGLNLARSAIGSVSAARRNVRRLSSFGQQQIGQGQSQFLAGSSVARGLLGQVPGLTQVDRAGVERLAVEDVTQSFEAQREQQEREARRLGVNPNSPRFQGLQQAAGLRLAEARAGASSAARQFSAQQLLSNTLSGISAAGQVAGQGLQAAGQGAAATGQAAQLGLAVGAEQGRIADEAQLAGADIPEFNPQLQQDVQGLSATEARDRFGAEGVRQLFRSGNLRYENGSIIDQNGNRFFPRQLGISDSEARSLTTRSTTNAAGVAGARQQAVDDAQQDFVNDVRLAAQGIIPEIVGDIQVF